MNTPAADPVSLQKLQPEIRAGILIVTIEFARLLSHLTHLDEYEWMLPFLFFGGFVVFIAGLCGTCYGLSLTFRLRGVLRNVALFLTLVSLYALFHGVISFGEWMIASPK